jgi:uncharacterized membrane protein YtjA (UPF0391 family)
MQLATAVSTMSSWAVTLPIIALIAAVLGFGVTMGVTINVGEIVLLAMGLIAT